ncbi:MAG: DUF697 domain-containing protein [Zoogloeaceae bacterium]|nr:DUF697 domain-containing protein [Zoogloeaceae bacterium]
MSAKDQPEKAGNAPKHVEQPVEPNDATVSATKENTDRIATGDAIIHRNMLWSAGAGVLPFPLFDMLALTGVQLKTISELCEVYETPFRQELFRPLVTSLIGTLGGSFAGEVVGSSIAKLVPGIGHLLGTASMSATFAGVTYAVGHLFRDHFEAGGTAADFNPLRFKDSFKAKVQEGMAKVKSAVPAL